MASVSITESAIDALSHRCNDPASAGLRALKPIPLLAWSENSYFVDPTGLRTQLDPQFYFYWTDETEINDNGYFIVETGRGNKLALAPGELFRSGSHQIDLSNGKLNLTSTS